MTVRGKEKELKDKQMILRIKLKECLRLITQTQSSLYSSQHLSFDFRCYCLEDVRPTITIAGSNE